MPLALVLVFVCFPKLTFGNANLANKKPLRNAQNAMQCPNVGFSGSNVQKHNMLALKNAMRLPLSKLAHGPETSATCWTAGDIGAQIGLLHIFTIWKEERTMWKAAILQYMDISTAIYVKSLVLNRDRSKQRRQSHEIPQIWQPDTTNWVSSYYKNIAVKQALTHRRKGRFMAQNSPYRIAGWAVLHLGMGLNYGLRSYGLIPTSML